MSVLKRGMLFVTFFGCCFGIALMSAAFGTKFWFESNALQRDSSNNSTEFRLEASGKIHFGLFRGVKILNWGIGDRMYYFSVNEDRVAVLFDGLRVATIICLSAALLFAVIGAIFAVINTASNPYEKITRIPGLYAWNVCAAICALLTIVLWGVQYHLHLTKNVLTEDEEAGWTTEGYQNLGYSYWLVVVAMNIHIINCLLIYAGTYEKKVKTRYEAPDSKPGNSMLY